jgi:hypothetical protein
MAGSRVGITFVALVVTAAIASRALADPSPSLTGKVRQLDYLVGSWACTTRIPAQGKTPAQTVSARYIYWIEAGDVIGGRYVSTPYSYTGYMGWEASTKSWWLDDSDIYGSNWFESGADSGTNVQTMTGTLWYGGKTSTMRDAMTKFSDLHYSEHFQNLQNGRLVFEGTSVCSKISN